MCAIAPSTPSTTFAAMMASRYSVGQSSSLAGFHARIDACASRHRRALRSRHRAAWRPAAARCVGRAGAIDQQRLGGAADAGAAHLGVEHDRLRHVEVGAPCRHRRGRCLRDARTPARAPRPARARPGPCRRAARSRRSRRRGRRASCPTAARSRVGTSWIACVRQVRRRAGPSTSAAWIARAERKLSEPPRRITALPALRQSAPASAVTFGRLS